MGALLEIDGLTGSSQWKRELRTVLQDVSFAIAEGEAVGLVGESGSGKSMTARAVARLLPPGAVTHGRISFGGAAHAADGSAVSGPARSSSSSRTPTRAPTPASRCRTASTRP